MHLYRRFENTKMDVHLPKKRCIPFTYPSSEPGISILAVVSVLIVARFRDIEMDRVGATTVLVGSLRCSKTLASKDYWMKLACPTYIDLETVLSEKRGCNTSCWTSSNYQSFLSCVLLFLSYILQSKPTF